MLTTKPPAKPAVTMYAAKMVMSLFAPPPAAQPKVAVSAGDETTPTVAAGTKKSPAAPAKASAWPMRPPGAGTREMRVEPGAVP